MALVENVEMAKWLRYSALTHLFRLRALAGSGTSCAACADIYFLCIHAFPTLLVLKFDLAFVGSMSCDPVTFAVKKKFSFSELTLTFMLAAL